MATSEILKARFCQDCNIPIKVFKTPYFQSRLDLYDPYFDSVSRYALFRQELSAYPNEQAYLEDYNRVKDNAINYIRGSSAYNKFILGDANNFSTPNEYGCLPGKDIFKPSNSGKVFMSIDMKKANFSALSHYNKEIFGGMETWEDFISMFTYNRHIIESKYIRQVIMGCCKPELHIRYEKYLMSWVLSAIKSINLSNLVFFSNDEIVYVVEEGTDYSALVDTVNKEIDALCLGVPFRVEIFTLRMIGSIGGYIKQFINSKAIEFKCIDSTMFPFVLRYLKGEEVREEDKVFISEKGYLAKFMEIPKIIIS